MASNQAIELSEEIVDFLASPAALAIAGSARRIDPDASPMAALGAVYVGLAPGLTKGIRNLKAYVAKYGSHHLRKYLRELREMRPLQREDS